MLRTRNICSQEQSFIHICLLRTLHIVHPVKLLFEIMIFEGHDI